jgi:hypothetical protein
MTQVTATATTVAATTAPATVAATTTNDSCSRGTDKARSPERAFPLARLGGSVGLPRVWGVPPHLSEGRTPQTAKMWT